MEQIYCYKMCRQITPQMFIALQGKSQFKIKVIQMSLWFVVCSHVKNFVVILVILQINISEIFQVFKVSKKYTARVRKCNLIISCDL